MPAVPPSYDQAVAGGAGGNVGGGGFYPQLPPQEKGVPPPANYGAPPPAGVPPPNAGTTTVVTQVMEIILSPCDPHYVIPQVQYVQAPSFGYRPVKMTCPHCQASITTKTEEEASAMAWILCGVCCFFGFWPCACIPFCVDSLQAVRKR